MNILKIFILLIFSFIFGSVPFGYILCKIIKKIDIRKYGSGNIGATNVYRVCGGFLGSSVLFLDIIKGYIPVFISRNFFEFSSIISILIGLAAILGHTFSPFLKGKGGKGISTSFGVIIALFPLSAFCSFIIFVLVLFIFHIVSVASITASFFLPISIYISSKDIPLTIFGIIIFIFIIYTHRENIKRLKKGKEKRIILPWEKK
ncbi:MAG TPA: glycerol-3-phosphate 1-O-acyltransferase PlsY [Candidatus Ratteibacteria bacterium]|nr:glycerol-3-phosphate 1-O-acyltransferase PlsY [Candidatus Ratteibacteria bacterium]